MKRHYALFLLMLLCLGNLFSQTAKPTIVVIPFDVKGVSEDEADVLFEVFQSEFANTGKAKIVDRSSLEKIKKQQEFQTSDWSNTDKVAEMGKALNASMVVTGQIMMFKSNLVTTIKLIDVNTTEIISSVVEKTSSTDDLYSKLSTMANRLSKKLSLAGGGKIYEVGDEGPGGGIVFYVSEDGFDVYDGKGGVTVCHYLEMSKNTLGISNWLPENTFCATLYGLGYGKSNTYKIINTYTTENKTSSNCAAYACSLYKTETTEEGDWFLPSKDELNLLYETMNARVLADTRDYVFWSSSGRYRDSTWYQSFDNGYQYYDYYTNNTYSVRAIRAFNN